MTDKFASLPATLAALLRKLADVRYSTRDVTGERMDWVKAGCPLPTPPDNWTDVPIVDYRGK